MREIPNSLLIYIPLFNKSLEFENPSNSIDFNFRSLQSLDRTGIFQLFEKVRIFESAYTFKKTIIEKIFGIEITTRLRYTLELFHMKTRTQQHDFYFFYLEIYSLDDYDFSYFVQYFTENKNEMILLIRQLLIKSKEDDKWIKNSQSLIIPFLYFGLIFYNYSGNKDPYIKKYKLNSTLMKDDANQVLTDSSGRIAVFFKKYNTTRSGYDSKIILLRLFLLRFAVWLNNKTITDPAIVFLDCIRHYSQVLFDGSANKEKYLQIKNNRNYWVERGGKAFNRVSLLNKLDSELSEDNFRKEVIIPILIDLNCNDINEIHGRDEFGIDILFSTEDLFMIKEWNAIIAKVGPINQNDGLVIKEKIRILKEQIHMAKVIPHTDINIGEIDISRVFIVTNSTINSNAMKILRSFDNNIQGTIFFIDRNRILSLY